MNVNRNDVGRGNQETQNRYSGDEGKQILGDGGKPNEPNSINKKTQRPEGIDRGDIRIVRHKRTNNFGLIKDSEEFGGIFRDDNEIIPRTVTDNGEGDQRPERWQYGESNSATEDDKNSSHNYCKRTHREEGKSMEYSLVEENRQRDQQISIDFQGGFTESNTSETSEYRRNCPNLLFTETEERHQISSEPKVTSTQKRKDSLGWPYHQLDIKNIAERERPEPSQGIDASGNKRHCGKNTTKHLSDININGSNSLQRGGLTVFPETIELQNDTIGGHQERRLSTEGYCPVSTLIPERLLQGSSVRCISVLTESYHSTNIEKGSNVGETKISQCPYPKEMDIP